jgi:2',3'-cyclic-nucleotide 2'-phosphodiesterase (5'-nucleotidase family)
MLLPRSLRIAIFCFFLWHGAGRLSVAQDSSTAAFTLTILHTNDIHGHIFPFAYTETGRRKEEVASVGGAARRATLVRKLRLEIKNPVILVDSGDTFTRGPLTNAYEGIADTEAMNAVGYDLAALGNNEFKAKDAIEERDARGAQSALLQVVKRSRFHWLCANATDSKGAFLEGVLPYVVREFNGVRVGFLGLTAPRVATYPQAVGWTISDPIADGGWPSGRDRGDPYRAKCDHEPHHR